MGCDANFVVIIAPQVVVMTTRGASNDDKVLQLMVCGVFYGSAEGPCEVFNLGLTHLLIRTYISPN